MKLVIEDEAGTRTVVPFTAEELTLGRSREATAWRLPARNVSRRHCRLSRTSGAVHLEDLGSRNGTWLNGQRIAGRRRVRAGDLIEIGDYDLVVTTDGQELDGPDAPPPLPVAAEPPRPAHPGRAPADRARGLRRTALSAGAAMAGGLLVGWLLSRLVR
jgi:predicted component of type VI protein secretion system